MNYIIVCSAPLHPLFLGNSSRHPWPMFYIHCFFLIRLILFHFKLWFFFPCCVSPWSAHSQLSHLCFLFHPYSPFTVFFFLFLPQNDTLSLLNGLHLKQKYITKFWIGDLTESVECWPSIHSSPGQNQERFCTPAIPALRKC